ncbi:hypothetical protein [Herbaspirillum sp. CAH-3]|uniref:hypothetical protein n=1 Tax=Herbaspirillum sp. CAH-3 TaxID=2605746 RepID=UPI0012AC65FD|nr:hypothetical protein [Herbaspirillum sp. CAH-3]MRT29956.1 hypothetical protein [Herbaspirillum sp. CAH-3]
MYDDPRKIRHRRIVVRVNDDNYDIMKALAQYQGENLATLAHDLLMHQAIALAQSYSMPILSEQNVQAKALMSHFSVPRNA